MDNTKIMGTDVSTLLNIKDNTLSGRISFFCIVCIIFLVYVLYNIAVVIWTIRKEELLLNFRNEIRRKHKKKERRKNAPLEVPVEENERNIIRSLPTDKDIEKAREDLVRFHKKKHL